ncbi:CDP-glycerol glycerophosphotransferase family protein [Ectobacillus funiculus]|uniref:CDP-glycerol glycerophosphotransferase family protein n=1 Tax=Ectobacillus funiculus TaxID=137993 RepID=UPI00397DA7A2
MNVVKRIKSLYIIQILFKCLFIACSWLPRKNNLVMFESYLGKQYSCNPRALYEYLQENHFGFELVWSVDKRYTKQFEQQNIPYVQRFSIRWFYLMARASYWITNSRMPLWIPKPKHTVYVQTWHGTPLKKLAADMEEVHMPGTTTEKYKENFYKESRSWDYLLSPNSYSTAIFKRAFQFEKEMIESGYPRNDVLYQKNHSQYIDSLKEQYGLPKDKKVILYAPTWRDDQFYGKGQYKFDLQLDLTLLQKKLGDQYIILLRMHYLVVEQMDITGFKGFAFDFSHVADINEIYLLSDLLITDYSSVFFDYANLKRPIIFYAYDIESYRDKLRGFYFDLEKEAPGPVIETTEQVLEAIREYEKNGLCEFEEKYKRFYNGYCYLEDGNSSKRAAEQIFFRKA